MIGGKPRRCNERVKLAELCRQDELSARRNRQRQCAGGEISCRALSIAMVREVDRGVSGFGTPAIQVIQD
jgi:hypothetical protein